MPIDEQNIREFLLGFASEDAEEEIGLRLIANEGFAERLDHAENELVEDYLDGLLSDAEKRLFHDNFLLSPERRELLREIKLVRAGVRRAAAPPAGARPMALKMPKPWLFSFFSRPLFAAAGLLVLLCAGFFAWYALFRDGRTPLEIEYAVLNRHDLTDPAKTGGLSVISLVPANFRDTASTAGHAATGLTATVVFRLALPVSEPEGMEIEASIERSGKSLFTVPGRVFRNPFGSELRFVAPKAILSPGHYQIVVRSTGGTTTYQLRIE